MTAHLAQDADAGRGDPADFAPRPLRRWIAIGVVSLLAHLVLLDALPRFTRDTTVDNDDEPIRARLVPLPPARPAEPVVEPPPQPRAAAKPATPPSNRRPFARPVAPPDFVPESLTDAPADVAIGPPARVQQPAPRVVPPAPEVEAVPPQAAPEPVVRPPQSIRLAYKAVYTERKYAEPIRYEGRGAIDWSVDAGGYRADLRIWLDVLIRKFDVLASHSDGRIGARGLTPDRYTEKVGRKSPVATNFNRDSRQSVTFSASSASLPLPPAAQDRLSIIFQLGSLLQGDPTLANANRIDVAVAGVRDLDTWTFETLGVEAVDVDGERRPAIHLRRVAKPETRDRLIEVWVTQAEGVPARVVYTEPDGSTYDLTLDRVEAPPAKRGDG